MCGHHRLRRFVVVIAIFFFSESIVPDSSSLPMVVLAPTASWVLPSVMVKLLVVCVVLAAGVAADTSEVLNPVALKRGTSGGLSEIYLSVCLCVCLVSSHELSNVVVKDGRQSPEIQS